MSGKRETSGKNGKAKAILAVLILAVVIVAIIVAVLTHAGSSTNNNEASDTEGASSSASDTQENGDSDGEAAESSADASEDGAESADDAADADAETTSGTLPEVAESTGLTLSSVYTSSILNPDCGGEYAENIASLEVTNSSDSYLRSATLTATMSDGTEVHFAIYDLPAGATAEIFDTENQTLASSVTCTSLVCTAEEYIDEDALMSDTIAVTTSGSDAIITNTGSADLMSLTVVYHCNMDGQYFGGASYTITIDSLAAGESYTLSDSTLMGEVAVVRIYQ